MTDIQIPQWTFTERLVKARRFADLAQEDLAAVIGVSHKTIGRWEREPERMKRYQLDAWAAEKVGGAHA